MKKPQAVLFDLDGTLIDSAPDIAASVNEVLTSYLLKPITVDDARSMIGNGVAKLVQRAFQAKGVELDHVQLAKKTDEMMLVYNQNLTNLSTRMVFADGILNWCKDNSLKVAVVTNKPEAATRTIIEAFSWKQKIEVIVGGDTCSTRKPEPEMLLHACALMSVEPSSAVLIGDSPADISAAQNAKMRSIAVRGGYTNIPVEDLGADIVVDDLSQVTSQFHG